jgi:hypothetical protein
LAHLRKKLNRDSLQRGPRRLLKLAKFMKVGMYLTPVGTICSMPADGRFSARPAGV